MKAVIEKYKKCNYKLLKGENINKEETTDKEIIEEMLNKSLINVGFSLADKMPPSSTNFESFLPDITAALSVKPLSEKEFKDAFFTLKTNRNPGYDHLHVNVIKSMYHELQIPLTNIFSDSLSTGIF